MWGMTFDELLLYAQCVTDKDPIADQRMAALIREVDKLRPMKSRANSLATPAVAVDDVGG